MLERIIQTFTVMCMLAQRGFDRWGKRIRRSDLELITDEVACRLEFVDGMWHASTIDTRKVPEERSCTNYVVSEAMLDACDLLMDAVKADLAVGES